ncbi:hypothetical protein BBF96_08450 [Anoxybacter fermentans]|uniref:DUF58 domain-containing protein n=1 Tax=Anoxybacter fermentans TaxID=1323375 RepID=A0A3Q9HQW1_9FIRM|nr:DUF58 domain-containing protein [Anoxybacter fermentans]AZR73410.1 hypothetical protein BBF96_08450 [Anoxybacter fermentans]
MLKKSRLPLLILFLLIAIFKRNLFLILGIMFILAITATIAIWNRFCFSKLKIRRSLTRDHIFLGEESQYVIEVENRKPLPIFWLQVTDHITKGINFRKSEMLSNLIGSQYNIFTDVFSLKWYEKVIRKYPVMPIRRGYFTFGKGQLKTTDLFGMNTMTLEEKGMAHLLVYPRIVPIEKFGLPTVNPFGSKRVNWWIYEDPGNRVGIRPYQRGDRLNQINWKATARHQKLQSYEIKPTMDTRLYIILNAKLFNNHWEGYNLDSFELAVMCAASVADYGLRQNYQVGFLTNGIIYEKALFVKILPGKSSNQRQKILKALAMIEPYHQKEIDQIIYRELPKMGIGTVIVFITVIMNKELLDCIRLLKVRGYFPTVIKIGEMEEELRSKLTGIPIYLVSEERLWNEIKNIQFAGESTG